MILGVTPTVDYAFKHVFGRDSTIPILMSVVDSVLAPAPAYRLQDLTFLNPFNPKEALDDKLSILDIKARDQSGSTTELDIWLYFYATRRQWIQMHCRWPWPNTHWQNAVEELKMLTQTDLERERYESRRKAQLDYNTGLKVARMEGRDEGRQEGLERGLERGRAAEKIHTIQLLERSLHRPETPSEQLAQRSLEELSQLVDQMLAQVNPQR